MNLNLSKLFLLPSNISPSVIENNLNNLINTSSVFNNLYLLEEKILPIISFIENKGVFISSSWIESEISRLNNLFDTSYELNSLITFLNSKKRRGNSIVDKELSHIKKWIIPLEMTSNKSASIFKIQGEWNLYSSYSGRMTAKKVPLTSIPKSMRKHAIASSSHKELWSIDLNQAELRFLAYYANDQFLLNHFSTDHDMYSYIGSLLTLYNPNVKPEYWRNICKTFLLAWLYGASTNTLIEQLRKKEVYLTSVDLKLILKKLELKVLKAVHYLDLCSSQNEVQTFFGRVMPLVDMKKSTKRNFALQSSVATAIKILILEAYKLDLDIVHVIHDELWIEVNPSYSNWQKLLQQNFEKTINRYHNGFPLNNILKFNQLKGE
ncbi:DNA polymerase [Staphylococcus hominis subsp. hominis]|uniref:DNA polymerase n=1 Tax=Staphylococcus hominis TaxID=1290 RepID=UPI001F5D45EE|nr:DNA polymerase [Staphylococcus hominis]MCI3137731.1 DNA polymerase [Staphylococcus hominis subsp. hominis]